MDQKSFFEIYEIELKIDILKFANSQIRKNDQKCKCRTYISSRVGVGLRFLCEKYYSHIFILFLG